MLRASVVVIIVLAFNCEAGREASAWIHGGGQSGQNVVDDLGVLVVDDNAVQVVAP